MGKQTHVAASLSDEQLLLTFLRQSAGVKLIESQAATPSGLFVDDFAPTLLHHSQYYIWNEAFAWQPELAQVDHPKAPPETRGRYYFANIHTAPVIEFDRSDLDRNRFGRLYWAKDFAAPNGLEYDVTQFDRWYQSVIRWVRKHGTRMKVAYDDAYFLPGAAAAVRSRQPSSD